MKKLKEFNFTRLDLDTERSPEHLDEKLDLCPTDPGVYVMKDQRSHVIYVGKAKNLRSRVRSYFQNSADLPVKTVHLVSKVHNLDFLRTSSEIEALLLENTLIKKFKPKYNIRLKDDKTYPYLKIDMSHPFPRVYVSRKQFKGDGNEYYGPFPMSGALRQAIRMASALFQLRDCRDHDFANRSRPCLSFEIGHCTAPCVQKVTSEQYADQLKDFRRFLNGEIEDLKMRWQKEMEEASDDMDFEKAARLRDRLLVVEETVGQNQKMVDTEDHVDKDIWAFYPDEYFSSQEINREKDSSLERLSFLVVQIRGGKWVGQNFRSIEIEESVSEEDLALGLALQYYQKHETPTEIIFPPFVKIPQDEKLNEGFLKEGEKERSQEPPSLLNSDSKESWQKLYELALENVKGQHLEAEHFQEKKRDGLEAIAKMLELEKLPLHMECVDISNMQGEANVASCVVFKNGKPEKTLYRHYNILSFDGQNDFASMKEVMLRRYSKEDSPKPDLLVIDGGKGQLSSVVDILKELKMEFPVVSLAKARSKNDTEERIFVPGQKNYIAIKHQEAFRIFTHLRDEAHRFAIEFHRLKRSKNRGL